MAASMEKALFQFRSVSLDDNKSDELAVLLNHHFNHALTVILPGVSSMPSSVLECFSDQLSYRLHHLPLYRLLEVPFLQAFVRRGAVHMMSVNTKLDTSDCVVVTPTGFLILNLTKDTHQELGLEARKQTHSEDKFDKYVVEINLLADHFQPEKKQFKRVLWCLKDRLNLTFDFLVSWQPTDCKICSSSLGEYFKDKCQRVERIKMEPTTRIFTSLSCPKIDADQPEGSSTGCNYREIFEWMGALACGVDIISESTAKESYVSSYTCPDPSYNSPRGCVFQVSGFLTPRTIQRVWHAIREHTKDHPESLPASLTVHGFSDCCVGQKQLPRDFYVSGSDLHSFILLPENRCWSYVASAS